MIFQPIILLIGLLLPAFCIGMEQPSSSCKSMTLEEFEKKTFKVAPEALLKQKKENVTYEMQRTIKTVPEEVLNEIKTKELEAKLKARKKNINSKQQKIIFYHPDMKFDQKKSAIETLKTHYGVEYLVELPREMKSKCIQQDTITLEGRIDDNITWVYSYHENKLTFNLSKSGSSQKLIGLT